jgi:hypothetical protein
MDYKDKIDVLMKFWRRKGSPNAKDTLFFGWKFENNQEYMDALSKYYGVEDLRTQMISEINDILRDGIDGCDVIVDLVDWNIEDYPMTIPYNGYGGKSVMKFKYEYDSNWVIPKDWMDQTIIEVAEDAAADYRKGMKITTEKFIRDEISRLLYEAYDDEDSCTFVKIYKATRYIRQKYGFISNIESGFYDYSEMDRLVDRYTNIVISKLP